MTLLAVGLYVLVGGTIELEVMRAFYSHRGPLSPPDGVVIVSIDDESYKTLDLSTGYPVPRKFIAEALERVVAGKPRFVMLDAKLPLEPFPEPEADNRIETALKRVPSALWNGLAVHDRDSTDGRVSLAPDNHFRRAAGMELRLPFFYNEEPALSIAGSMSKPADLVPVAHALNTLAGASLTTIPDRHDLINYYGPPDTLHRVSLASLTGLSTRIDPEQLFHGKVVVMGYESLSYGRGFTRKEDMPVPVSTRRMFETEVHATIVENLLEGSWLHRVGGRLSFLPLLTLTMLGSFVVFAWPTARGLVALVAGWSAIVASSYVLFAHFGIWTDGLGCCTIVVGLEAAALARYLLDELTGPAPSMEQATVREP